jgi:hypothetical protein
MLDTAAENRPGYQDRSALALALAQAFLAKIREAGATEEEALAALRSAEAMVPVMELYSKTRL